MAWYAYCITEQKAFLGTVRSRRPFPVEGLHGVHSSQVFAYPSGELAVIVSEYAPGELQQQAVIEHARVVSECFRNTTVLPFRFGTVFDSDEALRRAIRANRKAFTAVQTGMPTHQWEAYLNSIPASELKIIDSIPGYVAAMGGYPIIKDGMVLGGIGVSGANQEIDGDVALAALKAIGL